MIVDCGVYRAGERLAAPPGCDLAATVTTLADDDFLWLGVHDPSAEELAEVAAALRLHPLAVEDAVEAHQRPKIERYGDDATFIVLKTLSYEDEHDAVETGEIATFLGRRYLVTVSHGKDAMLAPALRRAELGHGHLGDGSHAAFYALLDEVIDDYADVAAALEQDVVEVEESVFSPHRTQDSERIYRLKRELLEVRRAVAPLREPLQRWLRTGADHLGESAAPFFRDAVEHLLRVHESIDTLDSLLDSALSAHLAQLSIQQNDDTRKISAWAALFLAPTLVAAVYGMNFEHMPELGWSFGYVYSLVLMVALSYGLYRAFKRSGWL